MNQKPNYLNTFILLLILAVLVVGGVLLVGYLRQMTQPLEQAERRLQEQFAQIVNPTPTILPDPITIVHQIQDLSRLETASYVIEKVITAESGQGAFAFLFGDRLILVAHGQVIAGVDLGKMVAGDIAVAEDGTVVVRLPPAEILVATLDNDKSYVYDRDTGLIGMNQALETAARQRAVEEITNAALEDGILETARRNAETYVRHLILSLGFREVVFITATAIPPTEVP